MLESDQKPIEILHYLVAVNNGRIQSYQYAAREADAPVLKDLFLQISQTSFVCRDELCKEIYKLGGVPLQVSGSSPEVLNAWLEVINNIGKKDHKAILHSCVMEEGAVIRTYERTLIEEDEHINTQQHQLLSNQHDMIVKDHTKVKNLLNVLMKK